MKDLETQARAAADALRTSVTELAVPPRRSPSPLPRVTAAVVVVLALVAGGIATFRQDEDQGVLAGPRDVPRFVMRDLPDGLALSGGGDMPNDETNVGFDVWFYGDDGLAPTLMVVAYPPAAGLPTPEQPMTERSTTTIGGEADPYIENEGVRSLRVERDGDQFGLSSRTLDRTGLEVAAEELAFADGRPTAAPTGLPLLASLDDVVIGGVPLLIVPATASGHAVGYESPEADRQLLVATVEGGPELVLAMAHVQHPVSTRVVEVRGHEARLSTYRDGLSALIWQESRGVVVAIVASALAEPDVLAAAATIEEATDDEWAAILAMNGDEDDDDRGTITSEMPSTTSTMVSSNGQELTGTLANGLTWAITEADGALCAEVRDPDGLSRDCLSQTEQDRGAFAEIVSDRSGEPALLWGRCPEGAVSIEATGPAAIGGGACDRYFTFDVTGTRYDEVIFRDAGGHELTRMPADN